MSSSPYCGRFAPSPTGPLHAGSLLAAFGSWLLARHAGGAWWVRIEDLDPPREVAGAAQAQLELLEKLGLRSDGPVRWQHTRGQAYAAALEHLLARGLAFECHCSRADLAASGGVHHRCVARARRPDPAIRLRVPGDCIVTFEDGLQGPQRQEVGRVVGDFVLRRADGPWAYQLAVVVDDADQGMTDVVRGADLLDSTPRQILLQRALGLPTPRYLHLPVLLDAQGRKLSKSDGAQPLDADNGLAALRSAWARLGQPAHLLDGADTVDTLLHAAQHGFDPARLPAAPGIHAASHNKNAAGAD
ncbi:tRNA glutamyl-Q(34) synthetase GluQRS [Pseudoxanthomonas winnipegensis]|uniref:Glutamyl-Q tRNA(Asp) synthetase n=1 Tax=Pseudoxanthomonas winnipegensis TaxID=2480810 RepID=A0A4Q8L792_9GAMM|nr:tRNA glutamyl-Q(34) synthetase GluQRS [Pseudoxanthomonas winnipegensis]TAA23702.1 tRNA glutamyl-Q(34) synthetase GluQRS [Pseudoxanthomonas winnipegensis]